MNTSPILITGVAGFIGFHTARRLLHDGHAVVGVDNFSPYYDVGLKRARMMQLTQSTVSKQFEFVELNVADRIETARLFERLRPCSVLHLAAQPGVRHSLTHPHDYVESNVQAFLNVLEGCRAIGVEHLVYASSSSVYGANRKVPFDARDSTNHPVSLYAATKKANELMAHTYSHLFGIPTTGLRFFTVYGPWGRPDMAYFSFTRAILEGKPIDVFNHGQLKRDFTYIDDIVESIVRVLALPAKPDPAWSALAPLPASSSAPYRIYNIGNHAPVPLLHFIQTLEGALGKKAVLRMLPMQPGDVLETHAEVADLQVLTGFSPSVPIEVGISCFVDWYRNFYHV